MKIYKVKMLRWGSHKIYYILGYYSTSDVAIAHAKAEVTYRGEKYNYTITVHDLDIDQDVSDEYIFLN